MASRCFQHPRAEAVTTCTHCARPICQACLFYQDGSVFCGQECANARRALGDQVHQRIKKVRYGPGPVGSAIRYAVIAALIWAILEFFGFVNLTGMF